MTSLGHRKNQGVDTTLPAERSLADGIWPPPCVTVCHVCTLTTDSFFLCLQEEFGFQTCGLSSLH